jgi:hypothetical protein
VLSQTHRLVQPTKINAKNKQHTWNDLIIKLI